MMGIVNIVDRRKRKYRFNKVNAVVEPAYHDNSVKDCDPVLKDKEAEGLGYADKEHLSLEAAVIWAGEFKFPVTLYLYDKDEGIYFRRIRGLRVLRHARRRRAT